MKRRSNTVLIFSLFVCMAFFVEGYAQYDDRNRHPYDFSPGLPPGGDDPAPTPIDDYIPLLIGMGLALGYFVIKKKNKALE